jgi:hypothetical protein
MCVYVCAYVCAYACVSMYVCACACAHVYVYARVCARECVCLYACVYMYVCVCVCVRPLLPGDVHGQRCDGHEDDPTRGRHGVSHSSVNKKSAIIRVNYGVCQLSFSNVSAKRQENVSKF